MSHHQHLLLPRIVASSTEFARTGGTPQGSLRTCNFVMVGGVPIEMVTADLGMPTHPSPTGKYSSPSS